MIWKIMHQFDDRGECGCGAYANRSDDGGACTCGLDGAEGCSCVVDDDPGDCPYVARKAAEAWEESEDDETTYDVAVQLAKKFPSTAAEIFDEHLLCLGGDQ